MNYSNLKQKIHSSWIGASMFGISDIINEFYVNEKDL